MKQYALAIFMKAPRLGKVKTRMQPELTPQQSLALYKAMGEDLAAHFRDSSLFDVFIYFWPPEAQEEMQEWLGKDLRFRSQQSGNLGEKMHGAFHSLLESGYRKVGIIGSDLPYLDQTRIKNALWRLDHHDMVLGPTDDGGYYLIALKETHAGLFENVPWSTEFVLEQTLENARKHHLDIFLLEKETDIDTYREVEQLYKSLQRSGPRVKQSTIPRTFEILRQFFEEGLEFDQE